MTPQEKFDSWGLKAVKFEQGYLAVPIPDRTIPMEFLVKLDKVPRCGEEYQYALLTCFCEDEHQLVACVSTASQVANYIEDKHYVYGCI